MKKINLNEAQETLPELIELALQGKEIVICMAGTPLVKLIPFQAKTELRKPGSWKGKVSIGKDFNILPKEFMEHFE